MPNDMTFADELRACRERFDWTQSELAYHLSRPDRIVKVYDIVRWEKGAGLDPWKIDGLRIRLAEVAAEDEES